ncbi:hypothetical protein COT95_01230 [Candidatus Falkowbacteria bacterium CG10_big_fil_rev_8_21_14_0_10_37_6]|uniref:Uncharacterized protein n=1 Tax=Candidatus Falkowbacteria bacterium CG10_big_fil_rev_8_21_14_0_10_37_6 TaxID=1974563 RepID=A0A2H0V9H4_9BACT|nr:MAG: hypothetical protein COT95_01230 [Candidatus Falkowbacteria bacterium CG10_big_fil_rev_8_21_14_0_10_37_6]
MLDNIKINLDFKDLSWYVSISILAFIFSVFALIYKPEFIYYGFITFLYGVFAQIVDLAFHNIVKDKEDKLWILFLLELILVVIWAYIANTI